MSEIKILIIDDNQIFRNRLKQLLEISFKKSVIIHSCANKYLALKCINDDQYDLAFIDLHLTDGSDEVEGLEILEAMTDKTFKVIISSDDSTQLTKEVYQLGCSDFLFKGNFSKSLPSVIEKFNFARQEDSFEKRFKEIFATSDAELYSFVKEIVSSKGDNRSLLLLGETGVGKTMLANEIHNFTIGMEQPFISVSCPAISENLFESEMFGYEKGAHNTATQSKIGILELANNGTLFLDEVSSMNIELQKKFLKVLEEKVFYRLGGITPIQSNFRLITATCQNLKELVDEGKFREDLYFRIKGSVLTLKSLRRRKPDILPMLYKFIYESGRNVKLSREAENVLLQYPWPGNIRELKIIALDLSKCSKGYLEKEDVLKILKSSDISFTDEATLINQTSFTTEEQLSFAKKFGMKDCFKKLKKSLCEEELKRNGNVIRLVRETFSLNNDAFRNIMSFKE